MNHPSPRFTGIFIPSEVLEHPDLTMLEQLLLSWIDALYCKNHKGCYAKNEYFAARLKVKENTIAKALTSLRQKDLIEDVSFDGRNRVIRAKIGEYVSKAQSNAGLDLNPMQGLTEIQPRVGEKSNATYIESKEELKEDNTPPIPPQVPEKENAAKAACVDVPKSSKAKREKPDFSPKVREVCNQLINIIVKYNPVYRPPGDLTKFLAAIAAMIETDKQDVDVLLKTFVWAVSDNEERGDFKGWQGVICTNNKGGRVTTPADIFRKHFSKIHSQMTSRPKRKFAPSSNDAVALEAMEEMNKRAL